MVCCKDIYFELISNRTDFDKINDPYSIMSITILHIRCFFLYFSESAVIFKKQILIFIFENLIN